MTERAPGAADLDELETREPWVWSNAEFRALLAEVRRLRADLAAGQARGGGGMTKSLDPHMVEALCYEARRETEAERDDARRRQANAESKARSLKEERDEFLAKWAAAQARAATAQHALSLILEQDPETRRWYYR